MTSPSDHRVPEHTVMLRFTSRAAKEYFLGQLSDGWGENVVSLEWPWRDGVSLDDASVVDVTVYNVRTEEVVP